MAKTATVSARIDEDVKDQAEDIMRQLGIPVSVVINTLYHQIINKNGIPFTLPSPIRTRTKKSHKRETKKMIEERVRDYFEEHCISIRGLIDKAGLGRSFTRFNCSTSLKV